MPDFKAEHKKIRLSLAEGKISKDLANYEAVKLNAWAKKLKSEWRASTSEMDVTSLIVAEDYKQLVESFKDDGLPDNEFRRECAKLLALCESINIKFPGPKTLVDDINISFIGGALLNEFAGDEYNVNSAQPQDTGAMPQDQGTPQDDLGGDVEDEYGDLDDEDEFNDEEDSEPYIIGSHSAGGFTVELWWVSSEESEFIIKQDGQQFDPRDGDVSTKMFMQYYQAAGFPPISDEEIINAVKGNIAHHERSAATGGQMNSTYYADAAARARQSLSPENIQKTITDYKLDTMAEYVEDKLYGGG